MNLLDIHTPSPQPWLAASAARASDNPEASHGDNPAAVPRALRVLIVEDEFFIALHTKDLLQGQGHTVVGVAVAADQAVSMAERERPDVVLMDIRLTGPGDGIDAAGEIRRRLGIPSIFVTANADRQTRQRAEAVRPVGFLEKPLTEHRLRLGLSRIVNPE